MALTKKENNNKINEKIMAISPRQSLIKRMTVYFGDELGDENHKYSSQKSVLVREIQDNSVDILRKLGKGGIVKVTFFEDGAIEVHDNGSGIPVEMSHTHDGVPASSLYLSLGVLNAGTNYEKASNSIGTNGVGGSGAQMLSSYMKVEVYRDKKIYRLDFQDGQHGLFDEQGNFKPAQDLTYLDIRKDDRPTEEKKRFPTGTKIKFKINDSLFKSEYPYEIDYLIDMMKGVSFLDGSILFEITDYQNTHEDGSPQEYTFNYGGGLSHIVDLKLSQPLTPVFTLNSQAVYKDKTVDITSKKTKVVDIEKEIKVEASFAYNNDYTYEVESFVNTLKTRKNGVHTKAFEDSLVAVFNSKLQSMRGYLSKNEKILPVVDDYLEGLKLAVSVHLPEPEFTHQTKESLGGKATVKILKKIFTEELEKWVNDKKNADAVKSIADKVIAAYKIRVKRTEEIEYKREQNKLERSTKMPSKLVDCEITHSEFSELFLVEGLSACTPLKGARNSKYQALLPLKGKILNVLKATPKDILKNQEVQDIIKCLDAGIGADFDLEKARYKKVFIACFTGDTSVKSLDGKSYTFNELQEKDIRELWVYSVDKEGRVVPKLAKVLGQTGVTNRLIEITLDNGEKIKSTEDHLYMTIDGNYIEAKDITEGTQLFPIHFRINRKGYEEYFDKVDNKYKLTYRMVAEYEHTKEKKAAEDRLKVEQHKKHQNSVHVHYINHNKSDNRPENLKWLTAKEHMIEDNKSEEKKEHLRKLHREGVYESTHFGKNGYNGSDKHIEDIRRAHKNKKYKTFNTHGYNFSKKHNEVVTNTNKSEKKITADKKARFLKSILYLLENNLEINKENYMINKSLFAPKYEWGLEQFDKDVNKIKSECTKYKDKEFTPRFAVKRVRNSYLAIKNIIANTYNLIKSKEDCFNEHTYDKYRKCPSPKWENLFNGKYFNSQEELAEYAKNINHKVVSVNVLNVDETPVYCLSVDDTNNFLLTHGVVVHNCDMDYDGRQISNLIITLFNTLMPQVIESGNLYKVLTPLYIIKTNKKMYYCIDNKEKDDALKEIGNSRYEITRAKGLGEAGELELRETGMDPQTRRYLKITKENAEQAEEMLNIVMGDDVSLRKKWLEENPYIPDEEDTVD